MRKILSKGWKRLLLLSIVGGLASIVMLACNGGNTDTKDTYGIRISPEEDEITANGSARFIAYQGDSRQRVRNVRWSSLDNEPNFENDFGLKIDSSTGVVTTDNLGEPDSKNGSPVKIVATSGTDSGNTGTAIVKVFPALDPSNKGTITIGGWLLDTKGAPRALTGQGRQLVATVEWSMPNDPNLKRWLENGSASKVRWEIEGESLPGTRIDAATGYLEVDGNESVSEITVWAISQLSSDESSKVTVRLTAGEIDEIHLSVVGNPLVVPDYNAKKGGENQIRLQATIVGVGNIGLDAIFRVEGANGRPINDLTQVRAVSRDGMTEGNRDDDRITEGEFSSVIGEANNFINITAIAQAAPLFTDKNATITIRLDGNRQSESTEWRMIRMGIDHAIAIGAEDGNVWTWGRNNGGQLGYDVTEDPSNYETLKSGPMKNNPGRSKPKKLNIPLDANDEWYQVIGGWAHSMALTEKGHLWVWGNITTITTGTEYPIPQTIKISGADYGITPVEIAQKGGSPWRFIAAGHSSAYAINEAGELYSWGNGADGRLGHSAGTTALPTLVPNPDNGAGIIPWVSITASRYSAYGVKKDGTLWVWGSNAKGQLGYTKSEERVLEPMLVTINLDGSSWRQVVAGDSHALGLDARGNIWSWGDVSNNRGAQNDNSLPSRAYTFKESDGVGTAFNLVTSHAANTSMAISNTGRLLLFGNNNYSQLATAETSTGGIRWLDILSDIGITDEAADTKDPDIDNRWVSIVTSGSQCLGIQSDGQLWAWGHNEYGQLGVGTFSRANQNPSLVTQQ